VAGIFSLVGDGKLSFAIHHEGSRDETVNLDFSLIGDELTLIPVGGGSVERYKKENTITPPFPPRAGVESSDSGISANR